MRSRWMLVLPLLLSNAFDQPVTRSPHVCPPPEPPPPENIYAYLGICTHEKSHLYGTVFDAEGTPVPYAMVRFWGEEWDSLCRYKQGRGWEARADSAGRYELTIPWGEGTLEFNDPHYNHFPRHSAFEDMGRSTASSFTADLGRYRLLVRKGATVSIRASDTRLERIPPSDRPREPWERLMRRYSRVMPVTVVGLHARADSTVDLVMQAVPPESGD